MKTGEDSIKICDMASEIRAARVVKAEFGGEESKKTGILPFGRADGFLWALFCCAVLGLSFIAAAPVRDGGGELQGALSAVGNIMLDSPVLSPLFDGAVPANGEADIEEDVPYIGESIPVISYLPYISAEQYIAEPPVRDESFWGIMPANGTIISGFSYRDNPLYGKGESAKYEFHKGIDIPLGEGTELFAFADGTVIESGENDSHGIYTVIDHGNGYTSLYAHMSCALRGVGAVVRQGDVIGLSGQTGRVTGPHLHFELQKDGVCIDPEDYIR